MCEKHSPAIDESWLMMRCYRGYKLHLVNSIYSGGIGSYCSYCVNFIQLK